MYGLDACGDLLGERPDDGVDFEVSGEEKEVVVGVDREFGERRVLFLKSFE